MASTLTSSNHFPWNLLPPEVAKRHNKGQKINLTFNVNTGATPSALLLYTVPAGKLLFISEIAGFDDAAYIFFPLYDSTSSATDLKYTLSTQFPISFKIPLVFQRGIYADFSALTSGDSDTKISMGGYLLDV